SKGEITKSNIISPPLTGEAAWGDMRLPAFICKYGRLAATSSEVLKHFKPDEILESSRILGNYAKDFKLFKHFMVGRRSQAGRASHSPRRVGLSSCPSNVIHLSRTKARVAAYPPESETLNPES